MTSRIATTAVAAVVVVLACSGLAAADTYAVVVAGSNFFYNYRHQTDICHSFHILKANGVPPSNIVYAGASLEPPLRGLI